jgi:hypothetical protein
VTVKLAITVLATGALLLHMPPISHIANAAAAPDWSDDTLTGLRVQLVIQSAAALVVLLLAIALSIHKPQGRTRYGQRKQQRSGPDQRPKVSIGLRT